MEKIVSNTFLIEVLLYVAVILSPILLWLSGYYDAFFPTSAYHLLGEKQLLSQSFIVRHAKLYNDYYPFSIYLIAVISEVAGIQFFHIGYVPVTFFLHYLFFSALLGTFLKRGYNFTHKWYYAIKFMFLLSLLYWAFGYTPLYYITLGSTALVIAIYLSVIYVVKYFEASFSKISNFVVTLLFVILCLFSYYTSGNAITFTFILYFVIKIFTNYVERRKKIEIRSLFLAIVTAILFLLFDKIFYSRLRDIGLSFNDIMMFFLERSTITHPIEYQYFPPILSFISRIATYVLILLLLPLPALTIITLMTKFKKLNKGIQDVIALLLSFTVIIGYQSAIYSFLMGKFTIMTRYLFVIPYVISILFFKIFSKRTIAKVYVLLILVWSLLNFVAFLYIVVDAKVFSAKTSYIDFDKLPALCHFYALTDFVVDCFADLKTSFTLPYVCFHSYLRFMPFERSMFRPYNDSFNVLLPTRSGIYIYTTQYSQLGVIMLEWLVAKPFYIFEENVQKIFDSSAIMLYYTQ